MSAIHQDLGDPSVPIPSQNPADERFEHALEALRLRLPKPIRDIALRDERLDGADRLMLYYGIDAEACAAPGGINTVVDWLDEATHAVMGLMGRAPTCVPMPVPIPGHGDQRPA